MVQKYINQSWPDSKKCRPVRSPTILVCQRWHEKLIAPNSFRGSMLSKIHVSHQGIKKGTRQAKDLFYWQHKLPKCESSVVHVPSTTQQKDPMIVTQVPDYQWRKVASDLFSFDGELYVLVGDYFSKFVEYTKLSQMRP